MTDRLALPLRYRKQLKALLDEHVPGVEVWAYGSRVNGESHEGSDLDLALRGPALEPLDGGFYDLLEAIEKSDIPILVQAHDWAMLPESFHREIERDYVVVQEGANRTMAHEWRTITLDQLGQVITGKTPSSRRPEYFGGGIQFVTPTDFNGRRLIESTERYLTDKGKNAVAGARIPSGAVMVSCIGSDMGKSTIASQACVTNQQINSIIVDSDNDPRFIYYNLSARREEIRSSAGGSAQPILNKSAFGQLTILLPPLPEQRAIAHVLGTLDDKIELNRRVSETLEAMARALFKSWFVYFEPVRAKMEGRWRPGESLPGLPADLYDLFPDRLVDSELGEVPDGWEVKALGECLATLETGKRPAGGVSGIESGMPSVGAESIERVGVFEFGKTKFVPWEFYDSMKRGIVQDGDVLIYKDGGRPGELSPAVTYTSHGFPFSECCINEHVFRVRSSLFSQQLLYCYLTTPYAFWQMREFATGVAQPGLNQRAVEAIAITMPGDRRVLRVCEEVIGPLIDGCNANALVSRDLSQIRDVLLPKLASGEIRII